MASIGQVTLVESERAGLADTLASVGPDAPTLCAGWTTTDLALHVVLRERLDPANPERERPWLGFSEGSNDAAADSLPGMDISAWWS